MRLIQASVVVMALVASTAFAQDADRKVAGGGITAKGWQGKIDPGKQTEGKSINDSKFMEMGGGFHMQVGPAARLLEPRQHREG